MGRIMALPALAALALVLGAPLAEAGDGDLSEASARATAAAQALADAQAELGSLEQEIIDLQARVGGAQGRLDALRAKAQEAAVEQFISAGTEGLAFQGEDINRQVRAAALGRAVTQRNHDSIEAFAAATQDLRVASDRLAARRAAQERVVSELRESRAALDRELERLEEIERARQAELARQAEARQAEARQAEARQAEARQAEARQAEARQAEARQAEARQAELARQQPARGARSERVRPAAGAPLGGAGGPARQAGAAPSASGEWVCPVQGPHSFVDSWGAPRSGGRRHQGVDLMAARGVPTVAPVSGRVVHRNSRLGGLSWWLYGDDGHTYFGTHLSAYANQGAGHVRAGTVIGYVGDTGNAAGNPHLHFEIHPNGGAPVNPYPMVARYCR